MPQPGKLNKKIKPKFFDSHISVLNGGIEGAMEAMNSAYGDQVDVECTPLRTYESFAEHVLGVDKTYTSPSSYQLGHDGHLFWLKFNVEYIGDWWDLNVYISAEEVLQIPASLP